MLCVTRVYYPVSSLITYSTSVNYSIFTLPISAAILDESESAFTGIKMWAANFIIHSEEFQIKQDFIGYMWD